jgi:glycerol-3-phosphate dehydrogenase
MRSMQRNLRALTDQTFDALIIGSGIFGAGVARDAALRGLRVALVERADFASGTSSRSSKLIHGGFRYLEQHAFGLVAEASRERRILQEIAPHRVRPLRFLLPVYAGDPRPLWLMRVGMTLYDLLAMFRNTAPHRTLSPADAIAAEPALDRTGLRGAIQFYDCQEDDARFCIDNILHACQLGAVCANYCEVTGFTAEGNRLTRATVVDRITGQTFDVRARAFINAAGPWVERVAAAVPSQDGPPDERPPARPALSPTKGVHVLVPRAAGPQGLFFQARTDGRMMFVLPWNGCTLIGTTDTPFQGDPADVRAEPADVEYLLDQTRALLPETRIEASDVIATIAGVRPLLKSDAADPSDRSREHQLIRTGDNLLSLCGGKYTTYRLVAKQAVDELHRLLNGRRPVPPCLTGKTPLPNVRAVVSGPRLAEAPEVFESDVVHAVTAEMAMTVEDVMWRRTGLMLSRFGGKPVASAVARTMQPILGWTDQQRTDSIASYLAQRSLQ